MYLHLLVSRFIEIGYIVDRNNCNQYCCKWEHPYSVSKHTFPYGEVIQVQILVGIPCKQQLT